VTTDRILAGLGLTIVLAVGSQFLANRLRLPAIIVLLLAGFLAGAATPVLSPDDLLGAAFQPLVSFAVAVVLYDAGLSLDVRRLAGRLSTGVGDHGSSAVVRWSCPERAGPAVLGGGTTEPPPTSGRFDSTRGPSFAANGPTGVGSPTSATPSSGSRPFWSRT
jgi:hypothetical protein